MTRSSGVIRPEEAFPLEIMRNQRNPQAQDSLDPVGIDEDGFDFNKSFWEFAKASREGGRSVWQLSHNILNYVNETIPIYLSVLMPLSKGNFDGSLDSFSNPEALGSIIFHVICVCIRFAVEYGNESTFRQVSRGKILLKFIASLLLLNKPMRYVHRHFYRCKKAMQLDDFLKRRRNLNKEDIKAVIDMNNLQLKDSEYEMTEIHVQALPMAVLQLYIILSNNEKFTVCSWADTKATTENAALHSKSMRSFLFLYKFENPSHPVNLEPGCCCTFPLNFSRNFLFTLHRFYCISFFLALSPYLAGVYVASVLISQWMMLQAFPEQMRLPFENPPFGIHTFWSDFLQQWINLFSNYRSKLDWVSYRVYEICGFQFQIFLSFLHIIPFIISMVVTFLAASFIGNNHWIDSVDGFNRTELVKSCPGMNMNETLAFLPAWTKEITDYVFKAHANANQRFTSFQEVFGVFHFLPFSMYFYFVVTFTYSYYLNQFRLINALFPVLQGYRMIHGLIFAILCNQSTGVDFKRRMLRRLMLLLQIVDDSEFYNAYRSFEIERLCKRRGLYNQVMTDIMTDCVRTVMRPVDAIQYDLIAIANGQGSHRHPLTYDFAGIIELLDSVDEKKLFLVFYANFDNRVRDWSSNRAKATYRMMGIDLSAYKYEFDL